MGGFRATSSPTSSSSRRVVEMDLFSALLDWVCFRRCWIGFVFGVVGLDLFSALLDWICFLWRLGGAMIPPVEHYAPGLGGAFVLFSTFVLLDLFRTFVLSFLFRTFYACSKQIKI